MEKILVTGATGYSGACIVEVLKTSGRYQVETLQCRLNDISLRSLDYDIVIHAAGALRHKKEEHFDTNETGTLSLIKGLTKPTPIIYISSRSVYAPQKQNLTESSEINPYDTYGQSKYLGEVVILKSENPYIILRATGLWGVGVEQAGILFPTRVVQHLKQNQNITLYLPDRLTDYLYVKDLAQLMLILLQKGTHWNQIFNVSSPARSLHELILLLIKEYQFHNKYTGNIEYKQGPIPELPVCLSTKLFEYFPDLVLTSDQAVARQLIRYILSN